MVCFENHAEWIMCMLFFVPRLTPVERPSPLLWRADLLSVASSFYLCVLISLCDAHTPRTAQGSRKHCSYHVVTIQIFTQCYFFPIIRRGCAVLRGCKFAVCWHGWQVSGAIDRGGCKCIVCCTLNQVLSGLAGVDGAHAYKIRTGPHCG